MEYKTLGIIGLGTIGKGLVQLFSGFNLNILAYDIIKDHVFNFHLNTKKTQASIIISRVIFYQLLLFNLQGTVVRDY